MESSIAFKDACIHKGFQAVVVSWTRGDASFEAIAEGTVSAMAAIENAVADMPECMGSTDPQLQAIRQLFNLSIGLNKR